MRFLLLSSEPQTSGKLAFTLESQFKAKVIEVRTIQDTINAVGRGDVGVLIYDYRPGKPSDYQSLWAVASMLPTIVCSKLGEQDEGLAGWKNIVGNVDQEMVIGQVPAFVQSLVERGRIKMGESDHGYCRIKTGLLIELSPLEAEVYIRLNDEKFLKLFKPGDKFELSDLDKYRDQKGVEYLWLLESHVGAFLNKLKTQVSDLLSKKDGTADEVRTMGEKVHQAVHDLNQRMGFTEEVQQLVRNQVKLTLANMGGKPELHGLLGRLKQKQGKYIASHSSLLAFLSCAILTKTKWSSDQNLEKMTLASYLHDLTLDNNDLAKLLDLKELEKSKYTKDEKRAFRFHPIEAMSLAQQYQSVPSDVDKILVHHHEAPDGSGFPRGLKHDQIPPLSAIFIVAHRLVRYMDQHGWEFDMDDFVTSVEDTFYVGNFELILESIRLERLQ